MSTDAEHIAVLELLADYSDDELVALLIGYRGGLTIHTTEGEPGPVELCAHPGHERERGYRGATLREVLIAALIDNKPEASADGPDD